MNTYTYTPSKELLSAVLSEDFEDRDFKLKQKGIDSEIRVENKYVLYCLASKNYNYHQRINIYELAIKTKQKYPDLNLNLAATDISEFWRQANILAQGANND